MGSRRPRIGLNLLFLRPGAIGGGETYSRGLLQGFSETRPPLDLVVFLNRAAWPTFDWIDNTSGFSRVLCNVPLHPWLRHVREQLNFSRWCWRHDIELLHSLGNVVPFFAPCPQVVTIHDLLYKRSSRVPVIYRTAMGRLVPMSARRSRLVLTDSYYSRRDIVELLTISPDKVCVTPLGPGQDWGEPVTWKAVQAKYNIPDTFFLAVGAARHKRLDISIAAIQKIRSKGSNVHLVVAGLGNNEEMHRVDDGSVHFLGYVSSEELATLYQHAVALICSSELEGFGLPLLEAMTVGTPVIATDRAALVEVVGGGGVLVEFANSTALAEMMWSMLENPILREHLRERGRVQAQAFSWRNCALRTAEAYEAVLNGSLGGARVPFEELRNGGGGPVADDSLAEPRWLSGLRVDSNGPADGQRLCGALAAGVSGL